MVSNRIWVGRLGEDPYRFTFDQIKNGAVRESGLFPELYESKWPDITAGVLATGVDRKYKEHLTAIENGNFSFPLYLPPAILPRALEDSKEAEKSQADIARGKLDKSFIQPFRAILESQSPSTRALFETKIKTRAKIDDLRALVAISDDRNSVKDPLFRGPLYGGLRTHWNDQVREIFDPNHLLPGKRVKETDSAFYGILNSIFLQEQAMNALNILKLEYDSTSRMDTTLCIASVIEGGLPLPEQGLIIRAEGLPFGSRALTEEDLYDLKKGRIFTHDDFNMIQTDDHPDGISLADLKRTEPDHPFLSEEFSPGRAMTAFAHIAGLPTREPGQPLCRVFTGATLKRPQTVVSNIPMLTAGPSREHVEYTLPLPPHLRLTGKRGGSKTAFGEKPYGGFRSLRELEEILHSGQAFVVQDPDKFDIPKDHGLQDKNGKPVSDDNIRLLRRLETDLIFAYLATMSTQPGSANHFGRSHMVEKSYWEKYGQWHPDFCNLGLAGDVESEAYRVYEGIEELHEGLDDWDEMMYKHEVPVPANDFMRTEEQLLDILGIDDPGYVVTSYGSASSYIDKAYKDPEEFNYQLAIRGITTNDGGGARSAMLGARNGNLRALNEGHEVLNIGIRSEKDVSPLEGNIEDSIISSGFEPVTDEKDPRHVTYADGQFHVLKLNRLLQRQAAIAAMADVSTYFAGGNGTVVEVAITRLHNAKVRIFGQGLFPGFDSDNRTIPMAFVNHDFEHLGQKRGIFDVLNAPYQDKSVFFDMHTFEGEDRIKNAVDFIEYHACAHGYKLKGTSYTLGMDGIDHTQGLEL